MLPQPSWQEDHEPVPVVRVSCGQLREEDVPVLDVVRADADELRRAMLAD